MDLMGLSPSASCECGAASQTAHHIASKCPLHSGQEAEAVISLPVCTHYSICAVSDDIASTKHIIILGWTTSLYTSSRTLFVREDVHVTSSVITYHCSA